MRPSKRLLYLLLLWGLLGIVVAILLVTKSALLAVSYSVFWGYFALIFMAALFDYWSIRQTPKLSVTRHIRANLALGVKQNITIQLINHSNKTLSILVSDTPSLLVSIAHLPQFVRIEPQQIASLSYSITPIKRGLLKFLKVCCLIQSAWKLWDKNFNYGVAEHVKIYPNYKPLFASAFLNSEHLFYNMGVRLNQQCGEGTDFRQLREFRKGDSLRQIDWRATARFHKPISREYQLEQDQNVFFMLDCGRRMRAKDEDISHFDHSLNAMLISAFIALRQGDSVGLMTFAAQPLWVSANKGMQQISRLLDQVYDLRSTPNTSDFIEASQQLMLHQTKRSLIVIMSSLEPEDKDDIKKAIALLSPHHIVIVASMKQQSIDHALQADITSIDDALSYVGASSYDLKRSRFLAQLRSEHVIVVDTKPSHMHAALMSEYVSLKRSGLF